MNVELYAGDSIEIFEKCSILCELPQKDQYAQNDQPMKVNRSNWTRSIHRIPPTAEEVPLSAFVTKSYNKMPMNSYHYQEQFPRYGTCARCGSFDVSVQYDRCANCGWARCLDLVAIGPSAHGEGTIIGSGNRGEDPPGFPGMCAMPLARTPPCKVPLAADLDLRRRTPPLGPRSMMNEVQVHDDLGKELLNHSKMLEKSQMFRDLLLECSAEADILQGGPTTLMIRNIPPAYTPEDLLHEWPNDGTYDFFYLPYNSRLQRNLTYAFINFTTPAAAADFKGRWQNMRLSLYPSQKPLNIGVADMQGCNENLRQLRKKRLLHTKAKQCQPVVFRSGVRIPLERAVAQLDAVPISQGVTLNL